MTSYSSGAAFDLEGNKVREFNGGGDHYGNFVQAVRSRQHEDLNADILDGHLSSALCHMGNISYRLGEGMEKEKAAKKIAGIMSTENMTATLDRTLEHLEKNGVALDKEKVTIGQKLDFDPDHDKETFIDNAAANEMLTRKYRKPFVVPEKGKV